MNWLGAVGTLLGKVPEAVANYYTRKQELNAQAHENALKFEQAKGDRQAQLVREGLAADASWEMEFAHQARMSWKDEYTLIVISIPAVMCFVPGLDSYVARGFEALNKTPPWYQILFCIMFCATVGIRFWRRNQSDT